MASRLQAGPTRRPRPRPQMQEARITRADLLAKLREANVPRLDQVRAVVMETTGDVSVLHAGSEDRGILDEELLDGVRGIDRIDFEADG